MSYKTRSRKVVARYGQTPGYHTKLRHVFPYFRNMIRDEINEIVNILVGEINEDSDHWFAVTGHPKTLDGHVTLWLSRAAAEYLLGIEALAYVSEYEPES
jgi:hypothetical protein